MFNFLGKYLRERLNEGGDYKVKLEELKGYLDDAKYPIIAVVDNRGLRSDLIRLFTHAFGKGDNGNKGFSHAALYYGKGNGDHEFAEAVSEFPFGLFKRKDQRRSGYIEKVGLEKFLKRADRVALFEVKLDENGYESEEIMENIRKYVDEREGKFNRFDNLNLILHYCSLGLIPQIKRDKKKNCTSLVIDAVNDVTGVDITPKGKEKSFVMPQKLYEGLSEMYQDEMRQIDF